MARRGHIPIRMCIGCRKRRRKEEMIRFTRGVDGNIIQSKDRGRGFYICQDPTCFNLIRGKNLSGRIPYSKGIIASLSNEA